MSNCSLNYFRISLRVTPKLSRVLCHTLFYNLKVAFNGNFHNKFLTIFLSKRWELLTDDLHTLSRCPNKSLMKKFKLKSKELTIVLIHRGTILTCCTFSILPIIIQTEMTICFAVYLIDKSVPFKFLVQIFVSIRICEKMLICFMKSQITQQWNICQSLVLFCTIKCWNLIKNISFLSYHSELRNIMYK